MSLTWINALLAAHPLPWFTHFSLLAHPEGRRFFLYAAPVMKPQVSFLAVEATYESLVDRYYFALKRIAMKLLKLATVAKY